MEEIAIARQAVASVLGSDELIQVPPSMPMGSEDFAWILEKMPGCYFALGNGTGEWVGCSIHNDGYDFNDQLIPLGAACWVAPSARLRVRHGRRAACRWVRRSRGH
ncbi:hypothetical protein P3W83_19455 [Cupriavidus basilensis]|nr:hypothetical protein [Cupriavidus basilensis]MDF3884619.1 hypothetical protein [Cupriavidus basilensis]